MYFEKHISKISESLKGKKWYHNDELEISKQLHNKDINPSWKKGRKNYGNKNRKNKAG